MAAPWCCTAGRTAIGERDGRHPAGSPARCRCGSGKCPGAHLACRPEVVGRGRERHALRSTGGRRLGPAARLRWAGVAFRHATGAARRTRQAHRSRLDASRLALCRSRQGVRAPAAKPPRRRTRARRWATTRGARFGSRAPPRSRQPRRLHRSRSTSTWFSIPRCTSRRSTRAIVRSRPAGRVRPGPRRWLHAPRNR